MKAYDIVLGIPWFEIHNPDIDWVRKRLISLRNPVNSGTQSPINLGNSANALAGSLNDVGTLSEHEELSSVQNNENEPSSETNIEMVSAVEFDCLLASAELSEAYALRLWQGTVGLLGGTEHGQEMSLEQPGIYSQTCVAS